MGGKNPALPFLILSNCPAKRWYLQTASIFWNGKLLCKLQLACSYKFAELKLLRAISPFGAHPELGHSFPLEIVKAEASLPQHTTALACPTMIDRQTVTKSGSENKSEPLSSRLLIKFNKPLFGLLQHFPSNLCHIKAVCTFLSAVKTFTSEFGQEVHSHDIITQ